jgi:DNA-binding XRE family transcriptional regulator
MAAVVGIPQSTLANLELRVHGDTNLSTAKRYAQFFGCTIEDLFPAVYVPQEAGSSR